MTNEFKIMGEDWTIGGWAGVVPGDVDPEGGLPVRTVTLRLNRAYGDHDEVVVRAVLLEPEARALVDGVLGLIPVPADCEAKGPASLSLPDLFNVAQQATAAWGLPAQERMVVEEVGEFLAAFGQFGRGRATSAQVASEIADVLVVLASAMVAVGTTPDAVLGMVAEKVERLRGRLGRARVGVGPAHGNQPVRGVAEEGLCLVVPAAGVRVGDCDLSHIPIGTIARGPNGDVFVRNACSWDLAWTRPVRGDGWTGWYKPNRDFQGKSNPNAVILRIGDGTFPPFYDKVRAFVEEADLPQALDPAPSRPRTPAWARGSQAATASTTNGTGYPFYSGVPLGNEVPPVGTIAHWLNSAGDDCVCVRTVGGWDVAFVADPSESGSRWFWPNSLAEREPPPPHAVVVHVGDGTFPTQYDSDEPGSVKQIVGEFLASRRS